MRSPEKGSLLEEESASGRLKSKSKLGSFISSLFCCFSICGSGKDGLSEDGKSLKSAKATSSSNHNLTEKSATPSPSRLSNYSRVSERNRAPSEESVEESKAWLSTWEEAIADGSQLLIQPAYKIPLYLILGYADPVTFLKLASTCHHIRSMAMSLSPEFKISIMVQFSPHFDLTSMSYHWNDNPMRMDQLVGLSRSNFKITVEYLIFIGTTAPYWNNPENLKETTSVLDFYGVKNVEKVCIVTERMEREAVFPTNSSPADLLERYKVKSYVGPFHGANGTNFLTPFMHRMPQIVLAIPANSRDGKEVEKFVLNTRAEEVTIYHYRISLDVVAQIIKNWADFSRPITSINIRVEDQLGDMIKTMGNLTESHSNLKYFKFYCQMEREYGLRDETALWDEWILKRNDDRKLRIGYVELDEENRIWIKAV